MLQVSNLHFRYGAEPVLDGVTLEVANGTLCGLFGPNGCGKTTLFRCCLNFLQPQRGTVCLDGVDVRSYPQRELARMVAYVPQEHGAPFPFFVRDVVLMGRSPHLNSLSGPSALDRERADEALECLGLGALAGRPYDRLSGGQRQLVLIARALAQQTKIVILDEPTSALDFDNQMRVWRIVREIARQGTAVLACSHDPNHVSWFCDQVAVINDQKLLAHGPPADVITEAVLDRVYHGTCAVRTMGRARVVMPRELVDDGDGSPTVTKPSGVNAF